MTTRSRGAGSIVIGVCAPLSRPGWTEAGEHLVAGTQLAAKSLNASGGIEGRSIRLRIQDTAADPNRAVRAVAEMHNAGAVAIAGEFHSVAARAAAEAADRRGIPFMCSSAVLDRLTPQPARWIARIAPLQSRTWRMYADYLADAEHKIIAVAPSPGLYWSTGAALLRDQLEARGCALVAISTDPNLVVDEIRTSNATAVLLLCGTPEPAMSLVRSLRRGLGQTDVLIGCPAGQPELPDWGRRLGSHGAQVPFLRYLPPDADPAAAGVINTLCRQLGAEPSFVALEGYDAMLALGEAIRLGGLTPSGIVRSWGDVSIAGTRGHITLAKDPRTGIWQWPDAPVQIVDRDPDNPTKFRVLHNALPLPSRMEN